jgi:hypothetical protein
VTPGWTLVMSTCHNGSFPWPMAAWFFWRSPWCFWSCECQQVLCWERWNHLLVLVVWCLGSLGVMLPFLKSWLGVEAWEPRVLSTVSTCATQTLSTFCVHPSRSLLTVHSGIWCTWLYT